MNEKNYSLNIDDNGNVNFIFDQKCRQQIGTPASVTTSTSFELIPGDKNKSASLVKTTTIKEYYQLKDRRIKKEDIEFALKLISEQRNLLTIELLYAEEYLVPGTVSKIEISKIQSREDMYRMMIDLEYDEYYKGELNAHKVKECAQFVVNKEKLHVIYEQMLSSVKIKDSIKFLQILKEMFKDILVPGSDVSEKEIYKEKPEHKSRKKDDIEIDEE